MSITMAMSGLVRVRRVIFQPRGGTYVFVRQHEGTYKSFTQLGGIPSVM